MTSTELKDLRTKTGLSQERFARLLGVSVMTVWRWEKGDRKISALKARGIVQVVTEHLAG